MGRTLLRLWLLAQALQAAYIVHALRNPDVGRPWANDHVLLRDNFSQEDQERGLHWY